MTISRTTDLASRRFRDADDEPSLPSTLRETPQARRHAGVAEATVARHLEQQPASTEYVAFLTHLTASPAGGGGGSGGGAAGAGAAGGGHGANGAGGANGAAPISLSAARDAAVQAKLDGVRDAFSGPYVVDGEQAMARPMFRMTTHKVPQSLAAEVDSLGARAGISAFATRVGQGTPKELVKITQALIDAGRLPPGPGDVAARIRKMQWDYGIGVDCAGYSKQALTACSPRVPKMYAIGLESFRDLDRARAGSFAKLSIENVRPGDLITLDAIKPEIWGHNVVVYSHVTADAPAKATLGQHDPSVRAFLASEGPHHVFEVDSSWGAGSDGSEHGGFRRDTWIYDASSRTWGSFEPSSRRFVTSTQGPANDAFHGAYRPR